MSDASDSDRRHPGTGGGRGPGRRPDDDDVGPPKPPADGKLFNEDELRRRVSKDAADALDAILKAHGKQIVNALAKNKDMNAAFLTDPIGTLRRLDIQVPPALARLGKRDPRLAEPFRARAVRLPNGQTVTPRIRVRFHEGGDVDAG